MKWCRHHREVRNRLPVLQCIAHLIGSMVVSPQSWNVCIKRLTQEGRFQDWLALEVTIQRSWKNGDHLVIGICGCLFKLLTSTTSFKKLVMGYGGSPPKLWKGIFPLVTKYQQVADCILLINVFSRTEEGMMVGFMGSTQAPCSNVLLHIPILELLPVARHVLATLTCDQI